MEYVEVQIPKEIANQSLPDPELRNFYLDLENRTFWLDNEEIGRAHV